MSAELPRHVKKYLDDKGVTEANLTDEALDTFASLSGGEIALLRKLGDSLRGVEQGKSVDDRYIVRVH